MSLTGAIQLAPNDIRSTSSTQEAPLGALGVAGDGRKFRYALAGSSALVAGKLQQSGPEDTAHQDLTPTAAAIGATSIILTLGASAVTENEYAEGYLCVTTDAGAGFAYKISSHPAADSSASLTLTLEESEGLVEAITSSSRIDLVLNPFSAVIINPTTLSSAPIGVPVVDIAAGEYGWIQTEGPAPVLADGANAVGADVVASNGTAGAVEDAASPGAQPLVGRCMTGGATGEYSMVFLQLD